VNLATIIYEAVDDIVALGLPRESVHAALDALAAWGQRPDAALWHAVAWAEATKP
jgi:hypothetical protein